MKKEQHPTTIHVEGPYIAQMTLTNDIHDNHGCNIYACPADIPATTKNESHCPEIPKEGDYNAVREYIAERKKYDDDFRIYWDSHNLKQNCIYLTREFGWIVDDHSLGTNLNRHR